MLSFVIFCVFNFPKINGKFNLLAKHNCQRTGADFNNIKFHSQRKH